MRETILQKLNNSCNSASLTDAEFAYVYAATSELTAEKTKTRTKNKHIAYFIHGLTTDKKCLTCNTPLPFKELKLVSTQNYCNNVCKHSDPNFRDNLITALKTNKATISEKRKKTILQKYGVDNVMKVPEVKESIKQRNREKHGVEWTSQIPDAIKTKEKTCMERYGTTSSIRHWCNNNKHPKLKIKYDALKNQSKYTPMFTEDEYVGYTDGSGEYVDYKFKCNVCGGEFISNISRDKIFRCTICEKKPNKYEEEIENFLKRYKIRFVKNDRTILDGLELDFYLPDHNIALELNGIYYHSTRYIKDYNYHINKTLKCKEKNINLVHIFSDELMFRRRAVFGRIRSMLSLYFKRVGARCCVVKPIDSKMSSSFLEKYHTQGNTPAAIKFGLYYRNRLISVMTFGKGRVALGSKHTSDHYELYRFCTMPGVTVIGGAAKMLKTFIRLYNPKSIISYCDVRWSPYENNTIYSKIGFTYSRTTHPNYWLVVGNSRKHRFNYRKSELLKMFPDSTQEQTELQIQISHNLYRIYDCGNHTYVLNTCNHTK